MAYMIYEVHITWCVQLVTLLWGDDGNGSHSLRIWSDSQPASCMGNTTLSGSWSAFEWIACVTEWMVLNHLEYNIFSCCGNCVLINKIILFKAHQQARLSALEVQIHFTLSLKSYYYGIAQLQLVMIKYWLLFDGISKVYVVYGNIHQGMLWATK